ncbi:DNA polymerase type-Y, HhH motif [Dillenia turbinata]|uniref:DNA polymerase kappa n=1 Tax=Dillenia turbinata TaxID=194707 RepID=A0AAN8ZT68_9MAGN
MEKGESSTTDAARPWQSYHTVYTNAKAGMEGVDKEKVQRIVYEMSKGSKYFQNEERKEAFIRQKIQNMREQSAKLTATDISHYQKVAEKRILELEASRDLSRTWLHVDMDAFYAAVETLSDPSLKGKPVAVGSMSMISTANYEARKFGVRAAMPGFIARKLCPELIFVPTDFKKYTYYSDLTRKVFQKYDPNFMATSLDEAYLDLSAICRKRGITGAEIAEELRATVYEETGLTCSAGVAPNRLLAKVCSDINKPNGQFVLHNDRMAVMTFISSLPIRKIGGVGKVTESILRDAFGIKTCEDLLEKSGFLCALFSHSSSDFFLSVGLGLGGTDTPPVRTRKSISSERTFSATDNKALLYQKLEDLADMLSSDMQKEGLCGRTLTLKLKTASFGVRTRAITLQNYICSTEDILKHASELLKAELPISLRLIGLRVSQFKDEKADHPPDASQKILAKFLKSRDSSAVNIYDESSLGSNISGSHLVNGIENGFPMDRPEICQYESGEPVDGNHQEFDHSNCFLSNDAGEMEGTCGSPNHEPGGRVYSSNMIPSTPYSGENEGSDVALITDTISYSESLDILLRDKRRISFSKDEPVSSSNQQEQILWMDGYKCSVCGIELPPSFLEERQEHADFHLAQKLQSEGEPSSSLRSPLPQMRPQRKEQHANKSRGKKQKTSSKDANQNHLPIDVFFVRSNQNF